MPLATLKTKGIDLEDVLTSGDGAMLAGMKDRRTFKAWAARLKIEPFARSITDGREFYRKEDADRIAKAYKEFLEGRRNR